MSERLIQDQSEDVPLMQCMYRAFTRMPGESYRRRLRSLLLYLCYVFRALINSLVRRLIHGYSDWFPSVILWSTHTFRSHEVYVKYLEYEVFVSPETATVMTFLVWHREGIIPGNFGFAKY